MLYFLLCFIESRCRQSSSSSYIRRPPCKYRPRTKPAVIQVRQQSIPNVSLEHWFGTGTPLGNDGGWACAMAFCEVVHGCSSYRVISVCASRRYRYPRPFVGRGGYKDTSVDLPLKKLPPLETFKKKSHATLGWWSSR